MQHRLKHGSGVRGSAQPPVKSLTEVAMVSYLGSELMKLWLMLYLQVCHESDRTL